MAKRSENLIIIANPIYDVVFKILMENLEVAREFLGAITGLNILEVTLLSQEHTRKDESGKIKTLRLDFCALVVTETGERFRIIIELQKQTLASNALRFRRYLASAYSGISEIAVDGQITKTSLPIISIYLLGFELEADLPVVTEVCQYRDLVGGTKLDRNQSKDPFIECLTHDAYFVQIPKITGKTDTRLETALSIFDQQCRVKDDKHRLQVDADKADANRFLQLVFRILERTQGDVKMEELMTLEDTFLLEQEMMADEVRRDLKKEQKLREEAEQQLKAAEQKLKELQAQLDKKDKSE